MAEDGTGNAGNSAEQPVQEWAISPYGGETNTAAQPVPIFEVAFGNDIWWSIPAEMSQQIYEKYRNDEDVCYTWDWGQARPGSWRPEGEETSINRYTIDLVAWEQVNIDNGRRRSVRLVFVHGGRVHAQWNGQIPT